ncbi:MAG: sugar phosphate isomerase/epimerase family protein [Anaerolineae bacterium]
MRLSISTGSLLPYPLPVALSRIARAGFEGIELVLGPETFLMGAGWVRGQVRKVGLEILSVHPPFLKVASWANEGEALARQVEWAAQLEAPLTLIHPPAASRWDAPSAQRYLRGLEAGCTTAQRLGVQVAIETAGRRWQGDTDRLLLKPRELAAFVAARDLAVVLDVTHVGTLDPTLRSAEVLFGPRLAGIHLSDMVREASQGRRGFLARFMATHRMPGDGVLPLEPTLKRLATSGFAGPVTLEVNPQHLVVWHRRRLARNLRQAAAFVRDAWRDQHGP